MINEALRIMPEKNRKSQNVSQFSYQNFAKDIERSKLEDKYQNILEETDKFNRSIVSYQANKKQSIHNWIKYKEGFSAQLVEELIREFQIVPNDIILDPFMGSGTTALAAKMLGINSVGMDILPVSHLSINVKNKVFEYSITELKSAIRDIQNLEPKPQPEVFEHLRITEGAFAPDIENDLIFFTNWNHSSQYSTNTKELIKFLITSILEEVSYTRKDGQYLRWDYRSSKAIRNKDRKIANGSTSVANKFNKGIIPCVKESLLKVTNRVLEDIIEIQANKPTIESKHRLIPENALYALPLEQDDTFNSVITSPPYCNRYDYTRTYALELSYLGITDQSIKNLRQEQLTCTVENKSKLNQLKHFYQKQNLDNRYTIIELIIKNNKPLNEILSALSKRLENKEINNKGIISMVEGYFVELTFIFFELFRTCKPGAKIAFVNDNVRYAGEIIPVDLLSTFIAEQIGFNPIKIYTLKQKKGNSSQQMSKYGRIPLRKSITIWEKPIV